MRFCFQSERDGVTCPLKTRPFKSGVLSYPERRSRWMKNDQLREERGIRMVKQLGAGVKMGDGCCERRISAA